MNYNKQHVASHFGRAAHTYDNFAQLQRDIGGSLIERLPQQGFDATADLGCGTGFFMPALKLRSKQLLGIDLSPAMAHTASLRSGQACLSSDAEHLAITDGSLDLVFSNLALQWCNSLPTALAEIHRCLNPGGYLAFSTLLSGTLGELHRAWAEIDQYPHVNRFISQSQYMDAIHSQPWGSISFEVETRCLQYPSVFPLLQELKGIGANYVPGGRNGLTTASQLKALNRSYERVASNEDGMFEARYVVAYGVLRRD
ncbi:malonyl-ACP O-methyltransferase BioC [Aliagarivorans taiwanensis]|uniref:malonyl-ACP O-methyltransferase BioC n=1 Tax=Aliagarivorans taiwanensis TaxID=561966 RepID=UPI000428D804|nr:malonyl-ACP O-methyltransferase BioC [Aliagarivorans taiwanensis]